MDHQSINTPRQIILVGDFVPQHPPGWFFRERMYLVFIKCPVNSCERTVISPPVLASGGKFLLFQEHVYSLHSGWTHVLEIQLLCGFSVFVLAERRPDSGVMSISPWKFIMSPMCANSHPAQG